MFIVKPTFFQKHPFLKDIFELVGFIAFIAFATFILNTYIYHTYSVIGISMENTLHNDDRVIVNRAIVSWDHFNGKEYIPERGQIIVFANEDEAKIAEYKAAGIKNPMTCSAPSGVANQYIIKRVIAFPGERVVVKNGIMTVYNDEHPDGFVYDSMWRTSTTDGPKEHTSGEIDITVPDGEIFVSGDNREGSNSWDSRNGLGTIPLCRIIGPVIFRYYPFNQIRTF